MGQVKLLSDKRVRRWPSAERIYLEGPGKSGRYYNKWVIDTLCKPRPALGSYPSDAKGKAKYSAQAEYEHKYGIKLTAEDMAWLRSVPRSVRRPWCLAKGRINGSK